MVDALLEQATWLTPTSLFLLLNVVIATILISSAFSNHPKSSPSPPPPQPPQLARAPSLFSRVPSFNFSNYYPDTTTTTTANNHDNDNDGDNDEDHRSNVNLHRHYHSSPSFFTRLGSFNFSGRADGSGPDEVEAREEEAGRPDQSPDDAGQGRARAPVRMARAGSFLSRVASFTYRGPRGPHGEASDMDSNNNIDKNSDNNNSDSGKKVEKGKKKKTKKKAEKATETTTFRKKEEEVDAKADDFINKFKQQLKMQRIESLMRYRSA